MALNMMRAPEKVIISPVAVDFMDSSGTLYSNAVRTETSIDVPAEDFTAQNVVNALDKILSLKQNRSPRTTAFDINAPDRVNNLRPDRSQALKLAFAIAECIRPEGFNPVIYGFADIQTLANNDPATTYGAEIQGIPLMVRAEESLALIANRLIVTAEDAVRSGRIPNFRILEGFLVRGSQAGEAVIPLRGYTYNRKADAPEHERVTFPVFPSCEAFMAAAVLDQLSLGEGVIRIIPASMKRSDRGARYLLEACGETDLPILTLALGSDGAIQKILPWSNKHNHNDIAANLRRIIKSMRSPSAIPINSLLPTQQTRPRTTTTTSGINAIW